MNETQTETRKRGQSRSSASSSHRSASQPGGTTQSPRPTTQEPQRSQRPPQQEGSINFSNVEPYCVYRRVLSNFWMVLMSAGLFALAAYCATVIFLRPTYTCEVTLSVLSRSGTSISQTGASTVTASTAEQLATLLSSNTLLNRVKRLNGTDVAGTKVSASFVKDTNLVKLTVTGSTPSTTYNMCVGVLEHYQEYAQYVFSNVIMEPISSPTIPDQGLLRYRLKVILIAGVLGALGMIALLAFLCFISGTIQTISGAHSQVDGELLVTLSHQKKRMTLKSRLQGKKTSLLISNPTTSFLYVESIHQLRSRLEHARRQHGCKVFVMTSVGENEGKSTVTANLALSLAKRHKKVLLVDCDLRKAAQHLIFEEGESREDDKTLTALLKSDLQAEQLAKTLHFRKSDNLFFLFAKSISRHSAELLGSERMAQLLSILREHFEYVILDTPPMGYFTDSETLCELADASLLVVRQDVVQDQTVNDAIDKLNRCKARFLGFVFNDVHGFNMVSRIVGGHGGYGYGYGHGYGYGYGSSKYGYGYGYGYGGYGKQSKEETVELKTSRSRKEE